MRIHAESKHHDLSRHRETAGRRHRRISRVAALLVPFALCHQAGSCNLIGANRGAFGGNAGGTNGAPAQIGRFAATPTFGQPFVTQGPILQPGGFGGLGGPP